MTDSDPNSKTDTKVSPSRRPGAFDIIFSVLSSFFGVQSSRNQERDFQHGQPIHFIIVGLGLTLLFILVIWLVVTVALRAAGA